MKEASSSFGEGLAMLAAAGGIDVHPHAASTVDTRMRWDTDVGNFDADLGRVEQFFVGVLEGSFSSEDEVKAAESAFYGGQGPWYTVGWRMAVLIEECFGREVLIAAMRTPEKLLGLWNASVRVCASDPAPRVWRADLVEKLGGTVLPIPPENSLAHSVAMRDAFLAQLSAHGRNLGFIPEMRDWTRPSLISWREEAKAVAIPRWEELGANQRRLLELMAGGKEGAPLLFGWLFRWFFIPHELAHAFQSKERPARSHTESEQLANDMAVAFLLTQPDGGRNLSVVERMVDAALRRLPQAVSPGVDPGRYFDEHYHELGRDLPRYGAFQLRFVKRSLENRSKLSVESVAARLPAEAN